MSVSAEKLLIVEVSYIREHAAIAHIMPIDYCAIVGKCVEIVFVIKKNRACPALISMQVVIQVKSIIARLDNRMIDISTRNFNKSHNIRIIILLAKFGNSG